MKRKILIIDDDVMTLQVLKKYLDSAYEVILENSGYRFIERMNECEAELILLDVEMPVMNGLEVFSHIRTNSRLKDVPVLFLSGVSNPEVVRNAMQNGAAGYFVKSSSKGELINKVESIFSERKTVNDSYENDSIRNVLVMAVEKDPAILREIKSACAGKYELFLATSLMRAASLLESRDIDVIILGNISSGSDSDDVEAKLRELSKNPETNILRLKEYSSVNLVVEEIKTVIG